MRPAELIYIYRDWFRVNNPFGTTGIALQVEFMEEEGEDYGGPSREFWRMFVEGVVKDYCVGYTGINLFVKNIPAVQVCLCVPACILCV